MILDADRHVLEAARESHRYMHTQLYYKYDYNYNQFFMILDADRHVLEASRASHHSMHILL
jgi:hypothetical protein